ncbi:hypothetical protein FRC17_004572 [Serendipita sp. 399]|nr:hypothetical protein FRC17_004572 [Serendipita sp. 399]
MRIGNLGGLLASLIASVNAIYSSQAGQIDWHQQYVGIPSVHSNALAPRLHRIGSVQPGTPAQSVLLTATKKNVLAAINPSEGNIGLVTLSGHGGATARIYEAINGNLIWEAHLHDPLTGHLAGSAPGEPTGAAIEFDAIDVFILSNGHTVRRISGATGETMWGWTSPDLTSSIFFTSLIRTENALYAIGVSKGFASLSIHVTSLDPKTGEVLHAAGIPSSINSAELIHGLKLGGSSTISQTAGIAWLEKGSLKHVLLTPNLEAKYLTKHISNKYGPYSNLRDLSLAEKGYVIAFLEQKENAKESTHIYRMDMDGLGLTKVGDFEDTSSSNPFTVYAGGTDRQGRVYISKLSHSATLRVGVLAKWYGFTDIKIFGQAASYEVFAPDAVNGRGMTTGFTFEYDYGLHGRINFATVDVANPSEYVYVSRVFLTTTTGGIHQWKQEQLSWVREESLTEINAIATADLPEIAVDSHLLYKTKHETFVQRLYRQLRDAKALPSYLFHFVQRFLTGTYSKPVASLANLDEPGALWRDVYGFKKVIVAATSTGKVFGIETSKGKIVWNIKLGAGSPDASLKVKPIRMVVLKTVSEGFHPEIGLVVEVDQADKTGGRSLTTGMVRLDATTGSSHSTILFMGETREVFEFELPTPSIGNGRKMVAVVDQDYKLHIYPYHADAIAAFNNITEHSNFGLVTDSPTSPRLQGYGLTTLQEPLASDDTESHANSAPLWELHPTWSLSFSPGERIVSFVRQTPDRAASHGRVLGDRTTLYKYLNPHLVAIITQSQVRDGDDYTSSRNAPSVRCALYIIDSSKGTILYSTVVPAGKRSSGQEGTCDVKVTLVENWLVYHYYEDASAAVGAGTKGWRMASVELYEGSPNVRVKSGELGMDSAKRGDINAIEQVYVFPSSVEAMISTTTKYGISSKDIVVINGKGQVQTFSRRLLDPRRPKTKPTASEQEEGLIQFDILLPDDPRRVVSHNYKLYVSKLLTTSTQLESTSLVLAYGIDLFLTRVAPSGTFDVLSDSFNKIQLVLTVLGLGAAILITKPLVKQKVLNTRWYS